MANEALRLIGSSAARNTEQRGDELNLRELWRAVMRRKFVLLATIVAITGATYAFVSQQTPLYTGEVLIHVNNRDAQVIQVPGVVEELVVDAPTIQSEIQFLMSPAFMRRMVEQLNLLEDPEFNITLQEGYGEPSIMELLNPMRYVPASWLPSPGVEQLPTGPTVDPAEIEMNRVIGAVSSRLLIEPVIGSYVISLNFMAEQPAKAATIANAIADEYLVSQVQTKFEAADRATDWLSKRIQELRGEVLESEAKIVEYRSRNNLVNTEESNPVTLQFFQLNTQLSLAQAERAGAEARLGQARAMVESENGVAAAAAVLNSTVMADLRAQELQLIRRVSELSAEMGERHPMMVTAQGELASVRQKMQDEVQRIISDLSNEVAVARARERELQNGMASLRSDASDVELAEVELRDLTMEADANRELFSALLTRFREIVEQQDLQEADVRIMSAASVPLGPSYPQVKLITAIGFAASMVLGVLLIFVVERWDTGYGFRSADEVQSALGLRALALVPDLSRRETNGTSAEDYIVQKPNSAYAEALQRIRTSLFLADGERTPKTVLVTSSVPLEGKSAIAASLARQSARSGLKVILVDADLRRPRLHEVLGLANQNGLSEVLTGRVSPEAAIKHDERSGLDFLPAGVGVVSPPDLFRSSTMRILLEEMGAYYDLVIINSPPVGAVSDGLTLSGIVDKSLYIIRWEQTPRNVVLAGMRQMFEAGADVAGVVLSRVDLKKHARYGYANSGYYRGSYAKYYVN